MEEGSRNFHSDFSPKSPLYPLCLISKVLSPSSSVSPNDKYPISSKCRSKTWRDPVVLMHVFTLPLHFPSCSPPTLSVSSDASGSWTLPTLLVCFSSMLSVCLVLPTCLLLSYLLLLPSYSVLIFCDSGYRHLLVLLKVGSTSERIEQKDFHLAISNQTIICFIIRRKQKVILILRGNEVIILRN